MEANALIDVIIAGGGPSGLYAGICLARAGFSIAVLEEHGAAGEPAHCTGILAPGAFDEFSIPRSAILNELRLVRFHSPAGQMISYSTEPAEALVVDRVAFDRALGDLGRAQGVEIHLGKKVSHLAIQRTGVEVHCAGETAPRRARACILATGADYSLQRALGFGFPPLHMNSAQIEVPAAHAGEVELYFGNTVAPKGFAWIVPIRRAGENHARLGMLCEGNAAHYFAGFLDRVRRQWGIEKDQSFPPRQRMLPIASIRKTYCERILVVGDAAGLAKPTTGGGIYYGLVSAGLAAGTMADSLRRNDLSESALSAYQERWQDRLMEELQAQLTLRLLLQRLTDSEIEAIFDLGVSDGLMPLIHKTATLNQHRKLIFALVKHPAMRKILYRKFNP
jgi:digeranylgeranylglycerophospholipid reductase